MLERFFHTKSIKGKLTAVMMTVTGIVLLLVTAVFVVNEAVTFRMAIGRELKTLATIVGLSTKGAIAFGDRKSAETMLSALSTKPHIESAYILTPDGAVFAKYIAPATAGQRRVMDADDDRQAMKQNLAMLEVLERESNLMWEWDKDLEIVERVLLEDQEIGIVVIQSDLRELFARLKWFFVVVLVITVMALSIAYLLSRMMHRPISGPILDLATTMKRVTDGKEYTIRAQKQSSDEIGQLINGFNDMLAQIQKRDEELGIAASDMKEGNEELKAFIYSAAHDLRQPLVNIRGFTEETARALGEIVDIIRKNSERLPEKDRDRIIAIINDDIVESSGFIKSSVKRMDGLINALLKLSQIGHRIMRPERIDMNALVRTVMESLTHQVRQKNVAITINNLPDVVADRTAMEQIMANLLDNAIKYHGNGLPRIVELSGEKDGSQTTYHVRDNGRGISKDDLPKLFKIFRRLGAQDVPGQGVGLAYVRSLVRRQGGRIWCESELGIGSTFSFMMIQERGDG